MKNLYTKQNLLIIMFVLTGHFLLAQPTLEFSAAGAANGPTIANQVVAWMDNLDNPSGNTFSPFVPATFVTFSLSNQQYSLNSSQSTITQDVSFGGTINNSSQMIVKQPTYAAMNAYGGAAANNFTASPVAGETGQGISLTANYATEIFTSTMGLYNQGLSTTGRYYMADLTVTFSEAVDNPILHFVGLGGSFGSLGFSTELELQTSGVTLSELSGVGMTVASNKILNSAAKPSPTTGSGGASGSVLVTTTTPITKLVFKLYMRGGGGTSAWSDNSTHTGDAWMIGASVLSTDVTLPVKMGALIATAQASSTLLQWSTTIEQNSDHFDVQYSTDGLDWQSIGTVKAAGNSHVRIGYSYTHLTPAAGMNFYRVAEVDLDGTTHYSEVVKVDFEQLSTAHLSCYPNPTRDRVTITGIADGASIAVLSIDGKTLAQIAGFRSGSSVDLSKFPAGIYILYIHQSDGGTQTVKVQKY